MLLPGLCSTYPLLSATTLATEVVTPGMVLPGRTFPAAATADEYDARLRRPRAMADPDSGCSAGATTACGTAT